MDLKTLLTRLRKKHPVLTDDNCARVGYLLGLVVRRMKDIIADYRRQYGDVKYMDVVIPAVRTPSSTGVCAAPS